MKQNNKIWIETSFVLNNTTGIGAYVLTLMQCFKLQGLYFKKINLKLPYKKFKFIFHFLWMNTILYLKTFWEKPDIIIFPAFVMPYIRPSTSRGGGVTTVIHDLAHLRQDEMGLYSKTIFKLSVNIAIKKADTIVTVSNTVKQELIEKYSVNPKRIKVVYNAIGEHFIHAAIKQEILNKYNIKKDKYILSVATLNKRKNIPELIKAFESISDKYPDLKLVLVGGMGNENREKLTKHPKIIFTGYIPDEEIPTLYKNALLYIFPSLYEGFGTPIIEAQYSGCPLLCSDIPVFKEIAGNGAEFCNTDAKSIATQIEHLINDSNRRQELIKLGSENVKRFSLENVSKQLLGALES